MLEGGGGGNPLNSTEFYPIRYFTLYSMYTLYCTLNTMKIFACTQLSSDPIVNNNLYVHTLLAAVH